MSAPPPGAEPGPQGPGPQGPGPRWGMVVDVNRCVGCHTCTVACKHANATLPGVQWRQVLDVERGVFPDVERMFLVVGCQHCAEPPCVPVCPTGATFQRPDGIVAMDYDWCIGCGYCAVACPYQARTIAHEMHPYYGAGQWTAPELATREETRIGVAEKCTFCADRVDAGLARGLVPGEDPEATPACAAACIAQAITFGDMNDPQSRVARLVADNKSFLMHEELGTAPGIRYLYETAAMPGRAAAPEDVDDAALADPGNPLVGKLQRFWDLRAAMNFTLGGLGSGLAIASGLAYLLVGLPAAALQLLAVAAGAGIAGGLAFVFFEIARKARFLYALRRPHSSWMTREVYVLAVLAPLLVATVLSPGPVLAGLLAAAALAFLYCQARLLHAAKGIPAWRMPLIPAMVVASGVFEGLGALLVGLALLGLAGTAAPLLIAALPLALGNAALWRLYCAAATARGVPPLARAALAATSPALHAIGHLAPAALCLLALALPAAAGGAAAMAASGIAAIAGGAFWKIRLVTRAGFQQGFAIPRMPQRGSGTRAAPPRLAAAG